MVVAVLVHMRIHWLGLIATAVTGCSGLVDDGGRGGQTDAQIKAKTAWLAKALPSLRANCIMCHATGVGGSSPAPTYLAGGSDLEIRDNLLAFMPPEVNLDAPPLSKLLTRGPHDGPALSSGDASDILEWLKAEKEAGSTTGPTMPPLATAKFQPQICTQEPPDTAAAPNPNCLVNSVALDSVGGTGASVKFVIEPINGGTQSYMINMAVDPGTSGVRIEHPQFISWPADPAAADRPDCVDDASQGVYCPDAIDRFQTLVLNVAGGTPAAIPPGTQTFDKFLPTDMMTIQFKTVGAFQP